MFLTIGHGFAHLAAFLFGMTGILGALIGDNAFLISFGRASFAFISLWLASRYLKISLVSSHQKALVFSGVLLALHWVSFFYAIHVGGVAMATLGFASFPAFITLIERFLLNDTVSSSAWARVFVVMVGLGLVTPEPSLHHQLVQGLLWGIFSGAGFASLAVLNRQLSALPALAVAFWQNLIVAICCLPFVSSFSISFSSLLYLLILGVFCTALSQFLFVRSVQLLNARTVGLIIALEPVYAIFVAWLLFHDVPTLKMMMGAFLIIGVAIFPQRS